MATRNRATRRHNAAKAKARVSRFIRDVWRNRELITPQRVGAMASMHCTCPCHLCTHRHEGPRHSDLRRVWIP